MAKNMLHSVKRNTIWFLFWISDALTLLPGDSCDVWHEEDETFCILNSQNSDHVVLF